MSDNGNDKLDLNLSRPGVNGRNGSRNGLSARDAAAAKRGGQNVNHLLSFTLPPRSRPPLAGPARRSRRTGGGVPFNKERYVNAQYRFLVKPTGDYTAYFADPDIYLNWADILQVIIPTTSSLSGVSSSAPILDQPREAAHEGAACPICLSPPTAPRMTKCGHVYCYSCILQYLTRVDSNTPSASTGVPPPSQKWRRCPICWDAVYARDLKAVRWWDPRAASQEHESKLYDELELQAAKRISQGEHPASANQTNAVQVFRPGSEMLSLRLIERPHVTTLALPQSSTWPASHLDQPLIAAHSAPWHFQPDVMSFAKFMLASPEMLIESLTQDLDELREEIDVLKGFGTDKSGLHFISVAQKKVSEQMEKVQTELDLPVVRSIIGQVKNDLKEHEAAHAGELLRSDLSRRQRKRIERGHNAADDNVPAQDSISSEAPQINFEGEGKVEAATGAEEFLALRARNQGGSYAMDAATLPESGSDVEVAGDGPTPQSSRHHKVRKNVNPPLPGSSSYVFYQAASGQSIFLHPLDIKILLSHFGAYANFPANLAVKVGGADEGSMNEDLRRRCKYLNHISMAADVLFIEVDWEGMDLISKSTLRPYEQALRQRKNKRRDKERREDRAKTRAEEADLVSSQGGPAAAAAYRRRQEELAAFTSESNFPSDGMSRSFDSHRGGGALTDDARLSEMSTSPRGGSGGFSPSFRESALAGAERDFPLHPGAAATEDFPDSLSGHRADASQAEDVHAQYENRRSASAMPAKKTVWGTPSSKSSFASAIQGKYNDAHGIWDDHMEDAWHELEEDYVFGSTGSGRRPTAAMKEGRGLNKQGGGAGSAWVSRQRNSNTSSGAETPKQSETPADASDESQNVPGSGSGAGARSKKAKKKLILTGGGGGRGSR